jgi:hypothetical protein
MGEQILVLIAKHASVTNTVSRVIQYRRSLCKNLCAFKDVPFSRL